MRSLHITCAVLHYTSALVMLIVGIDKVKTARVVTVVALRNQTALHIEHPEPVSLLTLLVLCSVVSGTMHVFNSFEKELVGNNPFRWIDYAISSPMMVVVIALITGVADVWTLWGMAAMQSFLMIVSGVLEGHDNILPMSIIMAIYYTITVWGPIFHAIAQQHVPLFVAWIIATLFLLFASFGVVYVVAIGTKNKKKIEVAYATLSVAAKLSLQWLVYGGADSLDGEAQGSVIGIILSIVMIISISVGVIFWRREC